MSKFNKTKSPVVPTTKNQMGENAYVLDAREELVATVLTTFLTGSYYESEDNLVKRILEAASKCDPVFVAKLAIYARKDANMRSVTHLLAGYLSMELSGREIGKRFYRKIVGRPDDMSEILSYIKYRDTTQLKKKFKIPNHIKKGFKSYLESMDPYQIDKYKMKGKDISLIDLVNMLHPKPTVINTVAYERLVKGESLEGLYTSKILEKVMSKAGQTAKVEDLEVDDLKKTAIESVIAGEKGMPIFNLVRNLRNIINLAPDSVNDAIKTLTDRKVILGSKLLPFRFATAYKEIQVLIPSPLAVSGRIAFEKGEVQGNITENCNKVLAALEVAMNYSVENIPKLKGNVAILNDHSGSMRGDAGGTSLVSVLSKVTTNVIGDVFSAMMVHSQDNVYVGLFGDRLISVPVDRTMGVLKMAQHFNHRGLEAGPSTETGIYTFLEDCVKNKTRVDNLIIFSDMVIGNNGSAGFGSRGRVSFQELFKQFKKVNPQCNTISVDLRQTKGTSVFDKSMNITQISGWSDKIFDLIANTSKGYDELIKTIEKITI